MKGKGFGQIALAIVAVGVLMSTAIAVQRLRDARYRRPSVRPDTLYVTSGQSLRRLSLGYHALAADLYWIRAIQYYGGLRLQAEGQPGATEDYPLLYPLLDLTTTLDPRFNIAYRFGAIFLAEPPPGGVGRADLAIRLLEKGLRELPDKWEYMMDIGFVHYWWTHDYQAAAGWFERASRIPGGPWWLRSMAATTLASGGDRQTSRLMWDNIRQTAENDWLRVAAERALLQLQALDDIDALQGLVDSEHARNGASPTGWDALVRTGALQTVPVDPTGTPYEIDASGRVGLATSSPLWPLPGRDVRQGLPRS